MRAGFWFESTFSVDATSTGVWPVANAIAEAVKTAVKRVTATLDCHL